jgi:hypothetical protein
MTIADRTEAVRQALSAVKAAHPGSRLREVRVRKCLSLASQLHGEKDKLVTYLDRGWVWLDINAAQEGQAPYERKHEKWMAALKDYERAEDVLREVLTVCIDGAVSRAEVA